MIRFADIFEFRNGYQFFMFRPFRAVNMFIIVIAFVVCIAFIWSLIAKMDDVIKANALLRPISAISQIKTFSGGELLEKNYINDMAVKEGYFLLCFDASADILDLENSQKLMERLREEIIVTEYLLETVKSKKNTALPNKSEAYIRSQAYIIEYKQFLAQIEELETKLKREKALPESMSAAQRLEDIKKEIAQENLKFDL